MESNTKIIFSVTGITKEQVSSIENSMGIKSSRIMAFSVTGKEDAISWNHDIASASSASPYEIEVVLKHFLNTHASQIAEVCQKFPSSIGIAVTDSGVPTAAFLALSSACLMKIGSCGLALQISLVHDQS